jgi:hypothetical protein
MCPEIPLSIPGITQGPGHLMGTAVPKREATWEGCLVPDAVWLGAKGRVRGKA